MNMLLVGLGGCLGSIARYLTSIAVMRLLPASVFPWGTFVVNMLGCLVIGFLAGFGAARQFLTPPLRLFLFTGVLGGFTTFSAFGLESFTFLKGEQWLLGVLNIVFQVVLGIFLVGLGNKLAALF